MNVTVLVVTQDRFELVRLAIETFKECNSNERFKLWLWSNDTSDTNRRWYEENCDRVFYKSKPMGHYHAEPLDQMAQEVTTEFVLTLDNDTISHKPVLRPMLDEIRKAHNVFAVAAPASHNLGSVDHCGRLLFGQPRVDPYCALFRTHELARLTRHVSFAPAEVTNLARFYDTGGMLRVAAQGFGWTVSECDWVKSAVRHYGSMTWAWYSRDPNTKRVIDQRTEHALADWDAWCDRLRAGTEVVVARYAEDVAWTDQLRAKGMKVTVYDKGNNPLPGSVRLPNVGREAHTYAEHVARTWDSLPPVTAFTQGNPFDHCPDFPADVAVPTAGFKALGPHRMLAGPAGDACHAGLPVGETYFELTRQPMPASVWFAPGAVFLAHRDALRRYPAAWWARLAARLADPATQGHLPWTMERLWAALLTRPGAEHFHHRVVGWFDNGRLYEKTVREAADGAHFVEVGAWVGRSTSYLATEVLNSNKRIRLDVVDHFRGSSSPGEQFMRDEAARNGGTVRPVFERNVAPVRSMIHAVVELPSAEAAATYADGSLDFVFVDAGHSEDEVAADIAAWLPKIKPGGVLAGDDHTYAWPGVVAAVAKAFKGKVDLTEPPFWAHRVPK